MSDKATLLAETMSKQEEILAELLSVVVKQREALKEGRLSDLQNLMSDLRHVTVRSQAIETKRARAAADLASDLGVESIVSEIIAALPEDEADVIGERSRELIKAVNSLKLEMNILNRMMEEAKSLNEMMISEWRKIGEKAAGRGTFDAKI